MGCCIFFLVWYNKRTRTPVLKRKDLNRKEENHVILKAFKFRLYPNPTQQQLIRQTVGSARFVFNFFLAQQERQVDQYWAIINEMVQN
ncbi:helix-turn-helix domain-containing protein, partial [Priestia koreensis]|uniref:helix-turn-helix domain-containing protein n=1 Tax=Priestia koreensis TaxID=284581 RepID=UPI003458F23F